PQPDHPTGAVTEVLDPTFRTDHGVVAPVVRGVVALLVGGQHPVVQVQLHHGQVLDVDDRVQLPQAQRRPAGRVEPVRHGAIGVVPPVADLVVEGERSHPHDPGGVPAGQVVDDVQVVGTLLQQQTGAAAAVGVPVLEVVVPAVADEVPAPDRLDLP